MELHSLSYVMSIWEILCITRGLHREGLRGEKGLETTGIDEISCYGEKDGSGSFLEFITHRLI